MNNSNRFNILLKESANVAVKSKKNVFANNNKIETNTETTNSLKNRFIDKNVAMEREKKHTHDNFIKSLESSTEFPELQFKKQDSATSDSGLYKMDIGKTNFSDIIKLKNEDKQCDDNVNDDYVPPGCVSIKYDKASKKPIWIYSDNKNRTKPILDEIKEKEEDPYFVMQRVVELYNKRRNEYIHNWGIEEYDNTFMFQNYDYDYFDKLDEMTEKQIKKNSNNYLNSLNNIMID
jgi:hypothetical protein